MKQILSKDQVNANLNQIKMGTANCYKIYYNRYTNEPTFYIWFRGKGVAIVHGKVLYYHSFKSPVVGDEPVLMRFQNFICEPYRPAKTYRGEPKDDTIEKLLIACGIKQPKKILEVTPEQRLKQLECPQLANIYKMMVTLSGLSGDLIVKKKKKINTGWGWSEEVETNETYLSMTVNHDKGSFSFPIENYTGNQENDEEIQNIFLNALSLPVTSKMKVA